MRGSNSYKYFQEQDTFMFYFDKALKEINIGEISKENKEKICIIDKKYYKDKEFSRSSIISLHKIFFNLWQIQHKAIIEYSFNNPENTVDIENHIAILYEVERSANILCQNHDSVDSLRLRSEWLTVWKKNLDELTQFKN